MPDYWSINQCFGVTQYDLMSILDPNSKPICLLELCHLCQCSITDVHMCHESTARLCECSTWKITTNKTNSCRYL